MWSNLKRFTKTRLSRTSDCGRTALSITAAPITVQYTPDSTLAGPAAVPPIFIGNRRRLATCSGVAWFHDRYVATVNLAANVVHTYRHDPATNTLTALQTLVDTSGFAQPENLAFSPDGSLLAVCNSADGAVNLYRVDRETHRIAPAPAATVKCHGDSNTHGVSFSPCSRFLVFTTVDAPGYIRLYTIRRDSSCLDVVPVQSLKNELAPLKPKGIDFSPDGRFVAVCYAPNALARPASGIRVRLRNAGLTGISGAGGLLAVYAFAPDTGLAAAPISTAARRLGLHNPDDLKFLDGGGHLIVTDQEIDRATIVNVDKRTGFLGRRTTTLRNPAARLSFPHGVGVSSDGRYVAIANYGDDKFTLYAVQTREPSPTGPGSNPPSSRRAAPSTPSHL